LFGIRDDTGDPVRQRIIFEIRRLRPTASVTAGYARRLHALDQEGRVDAEIQCREDYDDRAYTSAGNTATHG
jgi:hypothetical protein